METKKYPDNTRPFPAEHKYLYFVCKDKPMAGAFQGEHGTYTNQVMYLYGSSCLLSTAEIRQKGMRDAQYYINVTPVQDVYTSIRFKDMTWGDYLVVEEGCRLNVEQNKTKQSVWPRSTSVIHHTVDKPERKPLF